MATEVLTKKKTRLEKIVEEIFSKEERQTDLADRQRQLAIEKEVLTRRAGVAQSVEQLIRNQQVSGSSPLTSSIKITHAYA